jgi:hypothetical protein
MGSGEMADIKHVATMAAGTLAHGLGISDISVIWFETVPYAFVGSENDGGLMRLRLTEGGPAQIFDNRPGTSQTGTLGLSDLAPVTIDGGTFLLAAGSFDDRPALRSLGAADGAMGALRTLATGDVAAANLSHLTGFRTNGTDFIAASQRTASGLQTFTIGADFTLTRAATVQDTLKTTLSDISALTTVTVGAAEFVLAASALDAGITSLRIGAGGALLVADTILSVSGGGFAAVTALATVEVAGTDFVLAASGTAGTITAFRINTQGVFFQTDHVLDTLETRFDGAQTMATFAHHGRSFVVTGGSDDGLSLLEISPTGQIFHVQSIANASGQMLDNVTTLEAVVIGTEVQILAAGAGQAGLSQFRIELASIGPLLRGTNGNDTITGTAQGDHIDGRGGNDSLRGGAGDDLIVDGAGQDLLTGGVGADVFVFVRDEVTDQITDFEPGLDRLDLSQWGRLHYFGDLEITATADGARIAFEGEDLILHSANLAPLTAADFAQDDFIFF